MGSSGQEDNPDHDLDTWAGELTFYPSTIFPATIPLPPSFFLRQPFENSFFKGKYGAGRYFLAGEGQGRKIPLEVNPPNWIVPGSD